MVIQDYFLNGDYKLGFTFRGHLEKEKIENDVVNKRNR